MVTTTAIYEQRSALAPSTFLFVLLVLRLSTSMAYSFHPTGNSPSSFTEVRVWNTLSATVNQTSALPMSIPVVELIDEQRQSQQHLQHPQLGRVSYDLGLGKNLPVVPKKRRHFSGSSHPPEHDEPFPANGLPSLNVAQRIASKSESPPSSTTSASENQRPSLAKRQRPSEIFRIQRQPKLRPPSTSFGIHSTVDATSCSHSHLPRMAWSPTHDRSQLDMNTIWVEMLLQRQRQDWMEASDIA